MYTVSILRGPEGRHSAANAALDEIAVLIMLLVVGVWASRFVLERPAQS